MPVNTSAATKALLVLDSKDFILLTLRRIRGQRDISFLPDGALIASKALAVINWPDAAAITQDGRYDVVDHMTIAAKTHPFEIAQSGERAITIPSTIDATAPIRMIAKIPRLKVSFCEKISII